MHKAAYGGLDHFLDPECLHQLLEILRLDELMDLAEHLEFAFHVLIKLT